MQKSDEPLVSIIMNCHNGEKYLHDALDSIIQQTYKNWEVIFWDNLSKDESKNIVKDFDDRRIKYHSSKNFLKLYDARNHAIKKATCMGVSGGVEGVLKGPSIMIGGDLEAFNEVKNIFSKITSNTINSSKSFELFGDSNQGHFEIGRAHV